MLPAAPRKAPGSPDLLQLSVQGTSPSGSWRMVLVKVVAGGFGWKGILEGKYTLHSTRLPAGVLHFPPPFLLLLLFSPVPPLLILSFPLFPFSPSPPSPLPFPLLSPPPPPLLTLSWAQVFLGPLVPLCWGQFPPGDGPLCCKLLGPGMCPSTSLGRSLFKCKLRG